MIEAEAPVTSADHSKWLTYEEAGRLLGVEPLSVKRRALRNHWPRMEGNDGKTRVAVPLELIPLDPSDPEAWDRLAADVTASETARELVDVLKDLAADARDARTERDRLAADVGTLLASLAAKSATVAALELEIRRLVRRAPVKSTRGILNRLARIKAQGEAAA